MERRAVKHERVAGIAQHQRGRQQGDADEQADRPQQGTKHDPRAQGEAHHGFAPTR